MLNKIEVVLLPQTVMPDTKIINKINKRTSLYYQYIHRFARNLKHIRKFVVYQNGIHDVELLEKNYDF